MPATFTRRAGLSAAGAAFLATLAACAADTTATTAVGAGSAARPRTVTITDETGRKVELQLPLTSVVSGLGGNQYILETIRAVGADDRVIGASASQIRTDGWGDYWDSFTPLDDDSNLIAGESGDFNYDAIIGLNPQALLTGSNSSWQEAEEKLAPFGIKVLVFSAWEPRFADSNTDLLAELFDVQDSADSYRAYVDEIRGIVKKGLEGITDAEKKSVYFEGAVDYQAGVPGGWDWVIQFAGGTNIFSDIIINGGLGWNSYDVEPAEIVARNPQVIVKNGVPTLPQGFYLPWSRDVFAATHQAVISRPGFDTIDAVRNDEVYQLNNFLTSAASKWVGVLYLATWLYPERFAGVDPEPYFKRWTTEFQKSEYIPASEYTYLPADRA